MTYQVLTDHSLNDGPPAQVEGELSIVSALGHMNRIAKIWEGHEHGEVTVNLVTELGREAESEVTFEAYSGWKFRAWIEEE